MNFLNAFENWEFNYDHLTVGMRFIKYKAFITEIEYEVEFVSPEDNNHYVRNFDVDNEYCKKQNLFADEIIDKFKPNPFEVFKVVSEITIDFINKYQPKEIKIEHVGEKPNNKLNARAALSYRFLKGKTDYYITAPEIKIYNKNSRRIII